MEERSMTGEKGLRLVVSCAESNRANAPPLPCSQWSLCSSWLHCDGNNY